MIGMLSCQEVTELVTEYLEGRMPLLRRAQLHMHVGMCRHCRAYLDQMRQTVRFLGKLPDEPMPQDVRDALMRRLAGMRASGD
jgi:anti-sigma factor RsiW